MQVGGQRREHLDLDPATLDLDPATLDLDAATLDLDLDAAP